MHRHEVNQRLLSLFEAPSYLEVGVQDGYTFHAVKAPRKVAVDPNFRFDIAAAAADPANAGSSYHALPSDDYFSGPGASDRFDLIFLDGLHTFDQTLRDLLNAIVRLNSGGLIVLDDTMPFSYASSIPSFDDSARLRQMTGDPSPAWMGDVYRLVFFVRDYLTSFEYATVSEAHGQTILWRGNRARSEPPRDVADIAGLSYTDFVFNQASFNIRPFEAIEAELRAARA